MNNKEKRKDKLEYRKNQCEKIVDWITKELNKKREMETGEIQADGRRQ